MADAPKKAAKAVERGKPLAARESEMQHAREVKERNQRLDSAVFLLFCVGIASMIGSCCVDSESSLFKTLIATWILCTFAGLIITWVRPSKPRSR